MATIHFQSSRSDNFAAMAAVALMTELLDVHPDQKRA